MKNAVSTDASIAYLKTVLGIDSFILPQNTIEQSTAPEDASLAEVSITDPEDVSRLIFEGPEDAVFAVVVEATTIDDETYALLERMITAMKQNLSSTLLLQLDESGSSEEAMALLASQPRSAVIVFGSRTGELLSGGRQLAQAQWLAPLPELPILVTHGLDEVHQKPELKKTVWQHLQMAMQRLG